MCLTLLTVVLSWPQFLCGTEQLGQISFSFVRCWALSTYCIFLLCLCSKVWRAEGWVWSKNHCVHVHNSQRIKILWELLLLFNIKIKKSVILVNVMIHINMEFTAFWRFTPRDIVHGVTAKWHCSYPGNIANHFISIYHQNQLPEWVFCHLHQ